MQGIRREPKTIKGDKYWFCPSCESWVVASHYHKAKDRWNGLRSQCKSCEMEKQRLRRNANLEKTRAYKRSQYQKHRLGRIAYRERNYWDRHVENLARATARRAVLSGKLKCPSVCSSCGSDDLIEAHHATYSKPLSVTWLCSLCHGQLHSWKRKIQEIQARA
jgi:hypothetical protein